MSQNSKKLTGKVRINKTSRNNFITYGIVILAYIIVQTMINQGSLSFHMQGMLVPVCVYAILAVSLNLTVGVLGELSLGHAGFFCVGAFSGAFFTRLIDVVNKSGSGNAVVKFLAEDNPFVGFIVAVFIGAAVAALFGMVIGIPVLRLRGDYLAIVTLAFGEIIKNIINILFVGVDKNGLQMSFGTDQLKLEAGGATLIEGAKGIMKITKLGRMTEVSSFLIGCVMLLITLIISLNIINSRTGRAVMAIRDDRIAAEATGINITKYKLLIFTVSAALAGAAGVLYAHNMSILKPLAFDYNMSILILVFVVLGGIGSIRGSLIAAAILYILPEMLRSLNKYRMLAYAIILIICMIFNWCPQVLEWREKLLSHIKGFFAKLFKKKGVASDGNA